MDLDNNCGIYKILCTPNNKIYIGSSQNLQKRFKQHINHLKIGNHINKHLQNAYNKYGVHNLQFIIIENVRINELINREQYWIDLYKPYIRSIGFNQTKIADRPLGYKHDNKTKKIMSEIKKRQYKSGEIKSNLKPIYGLKHSEETKEKIRISKLGTKNPMYGKKEDDDHKMKRMVNFLAKPKWNKGKTIKDDKRIEKLAVRKGLPALNRIPHTLIDKETNERWIGESLYDLSKKCPISISTLTRLKKNKCGKLITEKYKILW